MKSWRAILALAWLGALSLIAALPAPGAPGSVPDPVKDFIASADAGELGELLSVRIDFSGTGQEVVFLSWANNIDGKAGNLWTAYVPASNLPEGGGYIRQEDPCIFRQDAFCLSQGEDGTKTLLTYMPAGAVDGALRGYTFDGRELHSVNFGKIQPLGKDATTYESLFVKHDPPGVKTFSKEEVEQIRKGLEKPPLQKEASAGDGGVGASPAAGGDGLYGPDGRNGLGVHEVHSVHKVHESPEGRTPLVPSWGLWACFVLLGFGVTALAVLKSKQGL